MSNQQIQQVIKQPVKALFERPEVQAKFKELLGKRAASFCTSVLQIVASNDKLKNADANSVYQSAAVAATLDLPLNNNLGFAYIVPYNAKQPDGSYKQLAQFQLGYKGFIQLAQRSGQFKSIYAAPIYEGQIISANPLEGYEFDFTKKDSDKVLGYAAKFRLLNGFEAVFYMTIDQLKQHGQKYSKTFKNGLWQSDFDAMAQKTVIKLLLSRFAPLSVEMQKAIIADQAIIEDAESGNVRYIDNGEELPVNKELERARLMIEDCKTGAELALIKESLPIEVMDLYEEKMSSFLDE